MPIPIPARQKKPVRKEWQNIRPTPADLDHLFPDGEEGNIGLLLGAPSQGLVDVDLDCLEALAVADAFLPPTGWVSGRTSNSRSHRWYEADDAPAKAQHKFEDPLEPDASGRKMLCELRSTGGQTLVPPSVHPDGEVLQWHEYTEPARITTTNLLAAVSRLASAALLARHWPKNKGTRQDAALGVAGGLLRAGWNEQDVTAFLRAAVTAAGDDEIEMRVNTVARTAEKVATGDRATGWPSAAKALGANGDAVVKAVRNWLGLTTPARAADPIPESSPWPDPPGEEAFHGLAGRIVRTIEPTSEADPSSLLTQVLVAFGNVVGRNAHFTVEADRHHGNEFLVLVGRTSKARKGTSWGRTFRLFEEAEELWSKDRVQSGLSSGEGLIFAVRDPVTKHERVKERGKEPQYVEVEADPGVSDKRLLVYEPEFANVLKQTERQGNTLSAVMRLAWDGRDLRTLTKNSPTRATGAHVSLVGHITADELRRYLTETESANGFANRFLFSCADRSKLLPEGGQVDRAEWGMLRGELSRALAFAATAGEVHRDEEARSVWCDVYGELSEGKPGLAGALLARGEAHVMRLALLYALLDKSPMIRALHLLAAMALWDYCERSVRFVFGDSLGDPVADELLRVLRNCPQGLTRTEMSNYFQRHLPSDRIGRALGLLLQNRLVRFDKEESGGRPTERWFATTRKVG